MYTTDAEGRMELSMQEYAASPNWPCCNKPICSCGKARHPKPIRDLIMEAAMADMLYPEELDRGR